MEYKIEPQRKFSIGIKELWEYRELLYFFSWKDIRIKYKQTVLGIAWVVLQPLFMMTIFTFFFGRMMGAHLSGNIPYPVFVLSGLLLWNIFSAGMITGSNSIVDNSNIIKKIYFPRLVIPIASLLVAFFDFFISFLLYIAVVIYFRVDIHIAQALLAFLLSVVGTFFATLGPCCLVSSLNSKYRDFKYVIPFLMQILLFVTPIIYPSSITTHEWLQHVIALNPMVAPIDIFRWGVLGTALDIQEIAISLASSVCFFIAGIVVFRKTEYFFADII